MPLATPSSCAPSEMPENGYDRGPSRGSGSSSRSSSSSGRSGGSSSYGGSGHSYGGSVSSSSSRSSGATYNPGAKTASTSRSSGATYNPGAKTIPGLPGIHDRHIAYTTPVALGVFQTMDAARAQAIRSSAASIAVRGNAGNFPANAAKASQLAGRQIGNATLNSAQIRAAYQQYGTLRSLATSQLPVKAGSATAAAVRGGVARSGTLATAGRLATRASYGLPAALGAYNGYASQLRHASTGTKWANAITGALKEIDNTVVAVGTGVVATTLSAPTAIPTAGVAPLAIGVASGVAAERGYNATGFNRSLDRAIDGLASGIGRGMDGGIGMASRGYNSISSFASNSWGSIFGGRN